MVEDKATGLMLPEGTREKTREVWTFQTEIKHLKRAQRVMDERGVKIALVCEDCEKPLAFTEGLDGVQADCECKTRKFIN